MKLALLLIPLLFLSSCSEQESPKNASILPAYTTLSGLTLWVSSRVCLPWTTLVSGDQLTHSPELQAISGMTGMLLCELGGGDQWSGTIHPQKKDLLQDEKMRVRAEYIRNLIKNNTEITWGHSPIPSRHYTMKTYNALMQTVTQEDIPLLKILTEDTDNFVKIWADDALRELTILGTTWK